MSLTQALWALGGAVGSQIGGYSGAKLGRKATLIANNFFIIPGTLLQVSFYGLPILWLIIRVGTKKIFDMIYAIFHAINFMGH